MTRLTPAALAKLARTASNTSVATLTIATHPATGERYACWGYGCIQLSHALVEELAFPPDGSYQITAKGALAPAEIPGFSADLARARMLPILDDFDRAAAAQTGWLKEQGEFVHCYLARSDGHHIAVMQELWQAWTRHTEGRTWHQATGRSAIAWADSLHTRATALLLTIHPRAVEALPEWTNNL